MDADERPLEDVLAEFDADLPLARAETLPGSWYTDGRIATLEKRRVFGQSWQMVGRTDQLRMPGQYVTAEVGGEPILVVRGQDGVLRGFYNVCRHHAAAVMTECEGRADRLRCPYHGWTYGLDGALKSVSEFEGVAGFDKSGYGLVPVRVAAFANLVFVNLTKGAPSLDEWLGDRFRAEVSDLDLESLAFAGRREWTIACNWKVFVDNYLDGGYHVPFLHPGLNSVLSFQDYTVEIFDRVCLQSSPVADKGHASWGSAPTTANRAGLRPALDTWAEVRAVRQGRAAYYWLYPNLMLNWYEGYLDTNLVIPLGVDRMKVVFDFWFTDVGPDSRARNDASMKVSEKIQDEDHAICESVQRGLGSQAYRAGRLSVRREAGENLFHRLLAADLRRPPADRGLLRKRPPVL